MPALYRHVVPVVLHNAFCYGFVIACMPKTIRVSEEAYDHFHGIADNMDASVRDVVDDCVVSMGEIVGYCPEHGVPFTEDDIESRTLGPDFVRCPHRYQTQEGRKRAHQEVTDGSKKIPLGDLVESRPTEQDAADDEDGSDDEPEDDDGSA